MIKGRKVLIGNAFLCDNLLYFHSHLSKENRDDWTIGLKLNYNYIMLLVRSGHPQHKSILKLIHSLIESGINIKRSKLLKDSLIHVFFSVVITSNDEREKVYETKRLYVAWNELISLFKLLSFGFILSTCCLIIELLYFFEFFKLLKCT